MRVFICFSSPDRQAAEQVHLALMGAGHRTFYDKESLPPAGDFNSRIRAAVEESDLFVFLLSPEAILPGSYTLTELRHARLKWPHPQGRVLPVMVRRVSLREVPAYLSSVTVFEPEGSLPAEVLLAVNELAHALEPRRSVFKRRLGMDRLHRNTGRKERCGVTGSRRFFRTSGGAQFSNRFELERLVISRPGGGAGPSLGSFKISYNRSKLQFVDVLPAPDINIHTLHATMRSRYRCPWNPPRVPPSCGRAHWPG